MVNSDFPSPHVFLVVYIVNVNILVLCSPVPVGRQGNVTFLLNVIDLGDLPDSGRSDKGGALIRNSFAFLGNKRSCVIARGSSKSSCPSDLVMSRYLYKPGRQWPRKEDDIKYKIRSR